jgi:hypothetical protein
MFLATAAFLLVSGNARASETRADSLLYNMAFEDMVDVFLYPQFAVNYPSATFYIPTAVTNAYGGIIYGFKHFAFGLFVHRPLANAFNQYRLGGNNSTPLSGLLPPSNNTVGNSQNMLFPSGQVLDLIWGNGRVGGGLRFYAQTQNHNNPGAAGDTVAPNTALAAEVNVGFSINKSLAMHTNAGFGYLKNKGKTASVNIGMRYLSKSTRKVRPVIATEIQFRAYIPKKGKSSFYFGLPLKGGVHLDIIKDTMTAGLLMGLDMQMIKPGGTDVTIAMMVPTTEIAVEYYAAKWVALRAAIKGGWGIRLTTAGSTYHPTTNQLAFNTGVGFNIGSFVIDAAISYNLWTSGPDFIGGKAPGLFGNLSLTYNF